MFTLSIIIVEIGFIINGIMGSVKAFQYANEVGGELSNVLVSAGIMCLIFVAVSLVFSIYLIMGYLRSQDNAKAIKELKEALVSKNENESLNKEKNDGAGKDIKLGAMMMNAVKDSKKEN